MTATKKQNCQLIIEFDIDEICCRLYENFADVTRPYGKSAHDAFVSIEEYDPRVAANIRKAAVSVLEYFRDQAAVGKRPS